MTIAELHQILDDGTKKISLKELREIIQELEGDCIYMMSKSVKLSVRSFYSGEVNALDLALKLLEHVE